MLRTELGITSTSPPRVRSVVERHVTSVTTPLVEPTVTRSPGRTARLTMRPSPPTMLDIVSCRPSEMATETTPRAAMRPDGSTLSTGFMTERSANDQMSVFRMLMKIDALGTSEFSRTLFARPIIRRCATRAIATAAAMTTPFSTSTSKKLMTC